MATPPETRSSGCGPPRLASLEDAENSRPCAQFDLDAWRGDLSTLHVTIDQVVQSFISGQTRQLDAVAAELSSQKERISLKEHRFTELSESIASFVESEVKRLEACGITLSSAEDDALHEAYDAELPGPPALHRINRLWRKALKAFESAKDAKERETAAALEEQRTQLEARAADAERRCNALLVERDAELTSLREELEACRGVGEEKEGSRMALADGIQVLEQQLASSKDELAETAARVAQMEASRNRTEYERDAEREELIRKRHEAEGQVQELVSELDSSRQREEELHTKCADRAQKLEQMRRLMDEQELEMTQKIDRVQQYVKERQANALQAEKKQQDAEKMSDRWQGEVHRLQAEKDRLAMLVLDLEGRQNGTSSLLQGATERHQQDVAALQDALRRKEEEMRSANLELLHRRDEEYQAKVAVEKERERERSIALLKKKEQEVQIKDQQLRAAKQRIADLETTSTCASSVGFSPSGPSMPSSRGGSSAGKRPPSGDGLPPLPLSAR
ncbi:unnamed protein product [Polarella glacialis]|uniref:Uncharacterized protein n=1 Tax=Polarella glacialis TaxID=89957 RepID=A0A813GHZ4_POLGL|nr:unnamed protein product [Polarella glacialis]